MVESSPGLMDLLIKKMTYLNKAVEVHAQNVANANTPGYKSLEVAPFTFGQALQQAHVSMAVTDPHHLVSASMSQSNDVAVRPKGGTAGSDSQDVEQESMRVSQVGMEYQLVTSILHKVRGLFNIALKGSA